jgi:hypothetical protein
MTFGPRGLNFGMSDWVALRGQCCGAGSGFISKAVPFI